MCIVFLSHQDSQDLLCSQHGGPGDRDRAHPEELWGSSSHGCWSLNGRVILLFSLKVRKTQVCFRMFFYCYFLTSTKDLEGGDVTLRLPVGAQSDRCTGAACCWCGYSGSLLSALFRMMLVNYLGRKGRETCLRGVVVFSAGWDVFECTASLEKPLDRFLFNSYLTSCLQASVHRSAKFPDLALEKQLVSYFASSPQTQASAWKVLRHGSCHEGGHHVALRLILDCPVLLSQSSSLFCWLRPPQARTIREFDERFTSIMFGYPSNDHYYHDASPVHKLKSVQVPMLCLNAADDVFSPSHGELFGTFFCVLDCSLVEYEAWNICLLSSSAAIPVEAVKQNPNLALLITCHGGHIGFLEGVWPRQSTYMDRVFKQFAKAVIEQGSRLKDLSWWERKKSRKRIPLVLLAHFWPLVFLKL